jgi:predicted ATPase
MEYKLSQTDIERYYDYLCYDVLKNQSDKQAIYNAARSKSPLKKALNVYFRNILGLKDFYKQIVNELKDENSHLQSVIKKALIRFKPIHDEFVSKREKSSSDTIEVPPIEAGFTDDYKEIKVKKNVYDKFYYLKVDKSGGNELEFIDFLESNSKVK